MDLLGTGNALFKDEHVDRTIKILNILLDEDDEGSELHRRART